MHAQEITRRVVLDADCSQVWHALVDERARATWLDDARPIEVLRLDEGRSLTWRWATADVTGVTSTVELSLERTDDDRTVLTVTERAAAASPCSMGEASLHPTAWDRRLLGLELRCLLDSRALVGV